MRMLWAPCLIFAAIAGPTRAEEGPGFSGSWRLTIVAPLQSIDFLLLNLEGEPPNLFASIKYAPPFFPTPPRVAGAAATDDVLTLSLVVNGMEDAFRGRMAEDGAIRGSIRFQGNLYPAVMERSDEKKLRASTDRSRILSFMAAMKQTSPRTRVEKLSALQDELGAEPTADSVFGEILKNATSAGLKPEEVRAKADAWLGTAKPFGPEYEAEVRGRVVHALSSQRAFAAMALEIAQDAETAMPADAPLETRATVARGLAEAARLTGKTDLAHSAGEKADQLDAELDDYARQNVPPFVPRPSSGRKAAGADRVALVELFTSTQGGGTVAAEAAFDALLKSHGAGEVIALQYHSPMLGSDPLICRESAARKDFYPEFEGCPSLFVDGRIVPGLGGPLGLSETRYQAIRAAVEPEIQSKAGASIDLKATLDSDIIHIVATARATEPGSGSELRLRLAVVEEEVRYVGNNRLRLHRRVVRAMPGGAAGTPLSEGRGSVDVSLTRAEIRKGIQAYLADPANAGGKLPEPTVDLKMFSVVAFVQDEGTKEVLQAALVPVSPRL